MILEKNFENFKRREPSLVFLNFREKNYFLNFNTLNALLSFSRYF